MTPRPLALSIALLLSLPGDGVARSQPAPAAPTGSATASEDDDPAAGGSAVALVAPLDPKTRASWLVDKLDAAVDSRPLLAAKARIGVAFLDLHTGAELYARGADAGLSLASNAKLLTTIAALGTLGSGFRWRTSVFTDPGALDVGTGTVKGDLYVRGRGDPTLAAADLRALATEIAARGVRAIQGRLVIDTSYFDGDLEAPHFAEQPLERAGFRPPVASFGVARGAFLVNVIGQPSGGAKVWLEPDAGDHVKLVKTAVTSIATGRTRIRVDVKPGRDVLEVEVVGQIRFADGHWWVKRRVDDPARYAAEVFRSALAEHGVTFARRAPAFEPVPVDAALLVAHDSPPLSAVVREMNKASDNYYAETVLKTLGAESRATPAPATWADGLAAMTAYLATLGLPPGTYRSGNGSGLFASTEVSARQLVTLLGAAHADYRIGPDLLASLPVGGVDGTLARRWPTSAARGRVRAKTGTLERVTTLAGYVGVDGRRPVAFAILVNDIQPGQKGPARALADDMLEALVAYLEAERADGAKQP